MSEGSRNEYIIKLEFNLRQKRNELTEVELKIEREENNLGISRTESKFNALIIEQYQSDYPVVMHSLFGSGSEEEYAPRNRLITEFADKDLLTAWLDEHPDFTQGAESKPLPLELAPDVKDFHQHVEYINKVYPYLCIINCISIAQKLGTPYIYIMKQAAYYGNIQNKSKAEKLYEAIPKLIATSEQVTLYKSEDLWKIPANEQTVSKLRLAIKTILGKDESYDFSLTPAQNKKKKEEAAAPKEQKTEWVANHDKIQELKSITYQIRQIVTNIDVPEFYTPQQALKFLNENVKGKALTKAEFNEKLSPIARQLGLLSRAKLRRERLKKVASIIRKFCFMQLSAYNK